MFVAASDSARANHLRDGRAGQNQSDSGRGGIRKTNSGGESVFSTTFYKSLHLKYNVVVLDNYRLKIVWYKCVLLSDCYDNNDKGKKVFIHDVLAPNANLDEFPIMYECVFIKIQNNFVRVFSFLILFTSTLLCFLPTSLDRPTQDRVQDVLSI